MPKAGKGKDKKWVHTEEITKRRDEEVSRPYTKKETNTFLGIGPMGE